MHRCYSDMVEREVKCLKCDGTGSTKWSATDFSDELGYKVHSLTQKNLAPKNWKELLRLARTIYRNKCECRECLGTGVTV
jgi:hypothetical protein